MAAVAAATSAEAVVGALSNGSGSSIVGEGWHEKLVVGVCIGLDGTSRQRITPSKCRLVAVTILKNWDLCPAEALLPALPAFLHGICREGFGLG